MSTRETLPKAIDDSTSHIGPEQTPSTTDISQGSTQGPAHLRPRLTPRDILHLQRTLGNRSVNRLLHKSVSNTHLPDAPAYQRAMVVPPSQLPSTHKRQVSIVQRTIEILEEKIDDEKIDPLEVLDSADTLWAYERKVRIAAHKRRTENKDADVGEEPDEPLYIPDDKVNKLTAEFNQIREIFLDFSQDTSTKIGPFNTMLEVVEAARNYIKQEAIIAQDLSAGKELTDDQQQLVKKLPLKRIKSIVKFQEDSGKKFWLTSNKAGLEQLSSLRPQLKSDLNGIKQTIEEKKNDITDLRYDAISVVSNYILERYPPEDFTYVALGESVSTITTYLKNMKHNVVYFPVSKIRAHENSIQDEWEQDLEGGKTKGENLKAFIKLYFSSDIKSKILLFDYSTGGTLYTAEYMFKRYFEEEGKTIDIVSLTINKDEIDPPKELKTNPIQHINMEHDVFKNYSASDKGKMTADKHVKARGKAIENARDKAIQAVRVEAIQERKKVLEDARNKAIQAFKAELMKEKGETIEDARNKAIQAVRVEAIEAVNQQGEDEQPKETIKIRRERIKPVIDKIKVIAKTLESVVKEEEDKLYRDIFEKIEIDQGKALLLLNNAVEKATKAVEKVKEAVEKEKEGWGENIFEQFFIDLKNSIYKDFYRLFDEKPLYQILDGNFNLLEVLYEANRLERNLQSHMEDSETIPVASKQEQTKIS